MKLIINQPDFRAYETQTFKDGLGQKIKMRFCEELVHGRWEPFWSIDGRTLPNRK